MVGDAGRGPHGPATLGVLRSRGQEVQDVVLIGIRGVARLGTLSLACPRGECIRGLEHVLVNKRHDD